MTGAVAPEAQKEEPIKWLTAPLFSFALF